MVFVILSTWRFNLLKFGAVICYTQQVAAPLIWW